MKYFLIMTLCFLIILLLYVNFYTNVTEGAPQLPSGSSQGQINNIADMRTFLEQMYMICLSNPNDQSSNKTYNTNCYKISILATYLWPVLGPYTYMSLDDLTPIFGAPTTPTSAAQAASAQQNPTPPAIPVIVTDDDYQLFVQLAIIGRIIVPFATVPYDGWNSAVVWFKDSKGDARDCCMERWGGYQATFTLVEGYFGDIKTILAYFHRQSDNSTKFYKGDSVYTKLY